MARPMAGFVVCHATWYTSHMTTAERDKKIEHIVEQKILEFFGDPDSGLELNKTFLATLRKNMRKSRKLTSHADVLKKYGIR